MRWLLVALLASCGPSIIWSGHTTDRRTHVEVIEDGGLQYVVIDGKRHAAYRGIAGWSVAVAPHHVAFAAQVGRQWFVVHDGHRSQAWDAIGTLVLSSSGRLAYAAQRTGGWYVVVDGGTSARYDAIVAGTLQFSGDGKRVAFVGERIGRKQCVIDGKPGPWFDGIGSFTFASDGHYGYAARLGDVAHVVVDDRVGPPWATVSQLVLSATAGHYAYAAWDETHWRVIFDDAPSAAVDSIKRIIMRDDGRHIAWVARIEDRDVLALDGTPIAGAPNLRETAVAFRASTVGVGVGLAYVAPLARGGEQLQIDGKPGAVYDEIGVPVWSSTGRIAYTARRSNIVMVVIDGRDHPAGTAVGDPVFSPDGNRVAFVTKRGRASYVVVDGRQHAFDLVFQDTLVFSSNSKRWAVIAGDIDAERLFFALEDGKRIPLATRELYSAAVGGLGDSAALLRGWTQAEADR